MTGRLRSGASALWLLCTAAALLSAVAPLRLSGGQASSWAAREQQESTWQALNDGLPGRVQVTSVAVDPRDDGRIYAGTTWSGGLWISDDGGLTGRFAAGPIAGRVVYVLSIDHRRPDRIMAGTDGGLYRSDDAGRTWQKDAGLPLAAVYAVVRDMQGGVLAGGAGPEVYRQEAGEGASWRKLTHLVAGTAVVSLAARPTGGLLLAGTDRAGLFRSRDGGRTWENVSEIGPYLVAGLAFAGQDGRLAFVRTRAGLYATADGGETWRAEALDLPGDADTLAVAPTGEAYVGTSEGVVFRRAAGGEAGSGLWQPHGAGVGLPVAFWSLAFGSNSRWYAGTSRGLYLSEDAGLTWRLAVPGPGLPNALTLAMTPDGDLLLGTEDGVFRSSDRGQHWQPSSTGLPADAVSAIVPASGQPDRGQTGLVYAGLAWLGLYLSRDGGHNWEPTGWTARGTPALLVDPANPHHLFFRAAYERVYETTDSAQTWASRWEGMDLSTQVISLAMDPQQPGVMYAGATEGLFHSVDGAARWQKVGPELDEQTVFTVLVDPPDSDPSDSDPRDRRTLYAGATNGAYRSRDGGEHWKRWGQGLEDVTVTAVAFSPQEPGVVFAGTKYEGIFRSDDGGGHWHTAAPEPLSVNALLFSPDGHWLYAATSAGFYRLEVGAR